MATTDIPDEFAVLRSQRNVILDLIKHRGLDPREFAWEHGRSSRSPDRNIDKLRHTASGFFFEFDALERGDEGHANTFSPAEGSSLERAYPGTWDGQFRYVDVWLRALKRELDAPPLWEQLAQGEPMLSAAAMHGQNSPFSPAELAALDRKIDEVLVYLKNELPAGSIPMIEGQLLQLKEDARKNGRISWMQMTIGFIFTMIWSGLFDPALGRQVFDTINQAWQFILDAPAGI